ncbi:DUF1858 domain-containing protein [Leptotrichia sp. OH3620_COT-345]|uniref:PAS domain-containing protein n=1 Tax=Leptotrichia sp. OH3620_COT-345 TaxID=2491048 RepID=UPI000F64B631|nr:PAS domain-containing protein [Leptotrichia sp. OH3620_COT-345]RRD40011.1 DUF1858 domain-containing protein [Leptotrichia sp. OH3620_COT-345]
MARDMKEHLNIDFEMIKKMTEIKKNYIEGKTDYETTKRLIKQNFTKITPEEFAYSEQKIKDLGFDDNTVHDKMNDVLGLFEEVMVRETPDLPEGHPINTYLMENFVIKELIAEMKDEADNKFIKNKWLEFYEKLYEFNKHLSRKQHQLFSMLEKKGFDRPSRIMWSFDNAVRDSISEARRLLNEDRVEEFMEQQKLVWELTLDIMNKEEEVLYPTSLKLITEDEFKEMRIGDDEIGYCLIDKPKGFYPESKEIKIENLNMEENKSKFMNDLVNLLSKYNVGETDNSKNANEVFDVRQGKLTLEQINLIFRHMPVDLSFVDENEIVKFYTDTKHRVFPRSAGVIGRDVKNCHPRESVSTVQEIIEAFKNGEQDETDFWLEINGKFIYITYVAVRNEKGEFKGVLEMMQDVTKIRSLTGNRKLLTWENPVKKTKEEDSGIQSVKIENISKFGFDENSVIGDIIDRYPYIKEFMPTLAPEYTKLLDPVQYMIMSKVATLDMIAERGGFKVSELIGKIEERIKRENDKSEEKSVNKGKYGFTEKTVISDIIDRYPYIKEFMPTLSPVYKRLLNPVQYMIMSKVATLDMIAARGGFEVSEFIEKIEGKIIEEENK